MKTIQKTMFLNPLLSLSFIIEWQQYVLTRKDNNKFFIRHINELKKSKKLLYLVFISLLVYPDKLNSAVFL